GRLVRTGVGGGHLAVDGNADALERRSEEVRIRVRERNELEPTAPQLGERAGHLREGPPRGQRLAERVLLAGGNTEHFLRGEEREGLGQPLPVRDRPPILDTRLQLVVAPEQ